MVADVASKYRSSSNARRLRNYRKAPSFAASRRRRSNAAAPPGSGLGLGIAAAIANLHDFDLRFDDNHPGTVFEMAGRRK
jgi:hypothetical protein